MERLSDLMPEAADITGSLHQSRAQGTQRTVYPAVEYETVEIPLKEVINQNRLEVYPQIQGRDFFRIYLKRDRLIFQAGGFFGLIPINDRVALDVRSRVPT